MEPHTTAIDCTTTTDIPQHLQDQKNCEEANRINIMNHLIHKIKKYNRPVQKIGNKRKITIQGKSIIKQMNSQNITLLSHTFDKYGWMGPLVERYFF